MCGIPQTLTAMNRPIEIPLEKQFNIRFVEDQVRQMDQKQAQDFAMLIYRQMVVNEEVYKQLLKKDWGLDDGKTQG